jgi:hypothetical protein
MNIIDRLLRRSGKRVFRRKTYDVEFTPWWTHEPWRRLRKH